MSKIIWDEMNDRRGESGLHNGVLYNVDDTGAYSTGVAWNGLTDVDEAPTGAEPSAFYADNIKYIEIMSNEEFAATIKAFTYPDEFKSCIGEMEIKPGLIITQQNHATFGFVYKTDVVNGTGDVIGYKLHLVYGAKAAPSDVSRTTVNEKRDLTTFSWAITTTPVTVTGHKPMAHFVIDSTKFETADASKLQALEDTLFGTDGETALEPSLPLPDDVIAMFA